MNTLRLATVTLLLAAASLTACTTNGTYVATPHQRHRASAMDADTGARVQQMIRADERLGLRHTVRVNVVKGEAELLGEARNAQERTLTQEIAERTPGVSKVKNLMTLR
mgnify:CR=1 FL=1